MLTAPCSEFSILAHVGTEIPNESNAATIAAAAFPKFARGEFADSTLRAQANLALA